MDSARIHKRILFGCDDTRPFGTQRNAAQMSLSNKIAPPALPVTSKEVDAYIESLERGLSRDRHDVKPVAAGCPKRKEVSISVSMVATLVWIAIVAGCSAWLFRIVEQAFR